MNKTNNQLIKFGLILGLICFIATFVLALTYEVTKPKIDQQLSVEEEAALKIIMPDADRFKKEAIDGIEYLEAIGKKRDIIGYCIKATGTGYSGFIRMIVGIDLNGVIKGVRIMEHYETPGLGANINEIRPGESEPWFLRQFVGRSIDAITVKEDIDAVTGATISSKAVADAINTTVKDFLSKVKR